jgi:hypothetical protein
MTVYLVTINFGDGRCLINGVYGDATVAEREVQRLQTHFQTLLMDVVIFVTAADVIS